MKEGGDFLYYGFPKLWEIFFNEKLTFKEKPMMVIKEVQEEVDWVDYMDAEVMETMLKMEEDVFTITNEEPSDPSTFIMPIMGKLNNWTWVGNLKMWKRKCVMQVPMYFSTFLIR